jgi:hypothetical protein
MSKTLRLLILFCAVIIAAAEPRKHWAYQKPVKPALPESSRPEWIKNGIDNFVSAKLDEEGLKPSPQANRPALLRRLSLDLTGLPPTLEELSRFGSDDSDESWEAAVDYYLDSPHYGEQRARLWLDLARYADSHGYERDPGREMWLYRDWVIDAFNKNMPFDQFTIEQIAGDLLPEPTGAAAAKLSPFERESCRIASGFHRNTMFNTEGGVDREQARVETIIDRVNTTATVWLGTTLACAQCHNHKYDPFSQKEYFEFYAFFNNVDEPEIPVPSVQQEKEEAKLKTEIASLNHVLNTDTPELRKAQAVWEYDFAEHAPRWEVIKPVGALSSGGAHLNTEPDHSLVPNGPNPKNDSYTVVANVNATNITGFRLEVMPDERMPKKSLGRHENGSFVLSRFEVLAAPKNNPKAAKTVSIKRAAADYTQAGHRAMDLIENGKNAKGWAAGAADPKLAVERYVQFELAEPVSFPEGATLTFTLNNESEWAEANLGRFRLSVTQSKQTFPKTLPPVSILKLLATAPLERNDAARNELAAYYRSVAPDLVPARENLAEKTKALNELQASTPKAMVVVERTKDPRETRIQLRGNFLNLADKVTPAVPAVLNPLQGETNRLSLARWLISPDNPLCARVTVNRFWAQFFGHGIVETEEDFGTQGARPSHPKLLDWLATTFIESGWDVKALHKLIVMSATYRQTSKATPDLIEKDPANQFYARGPRFRVTAENVRDIALAASGLFEPKIGGPSVYPYQPDGIWTQIYGSEKWTTSHGADKYRRGIYTYWKRTSPYPAFMSFDAPSREACTARRPRTDTPLQALTTLNDPAFVEAAQALAQRMLETDGDARAKLACGFRRCLSRTPREAETNRLLALYEEQLSKYSHDSQAACEMAYGKSDAQNGKDAAEAAAWTVVANVLLNLDETITKS